jgi:predicted molibdopterin-dependent oxidoreductase YjgC
MGPELRASAGIRRSPRVTFSFAGMPVEGHEGESVAAALYAAGIRHLRDAPRDGAPRGAFCAMGICQECLVVIDGHRLEACRASVTAGLDVRRVPSGDSDGH